MVNASRDIPSGAFGIECHLFSSMSHPTDSKYLKLIFKITNCTPWSNQQHEFFRVKINRTQKHIFVHLNEFYNNIVTSCV